MWGGGSLPICIGNERGGAGKRSAARCTADMDKTCTISAHAPQCTWGSGTGEGEAQQALSAGWLRNSTGWLALARCPQIWCAQTPRSCGGGSPRRGVQCRGTLGASRHGTVVPFNRGARQGACQWGAEGQALKQMGVLTADMALADMESRLTNMTKRVIANVWPLTQVLYPCGHTGGRCWVGPVGLS